MSLSKTLLAFNLVESTQLELKKYLKAHPDVEGVVGLMAHSQSAGKGRGVSKWHDLPGKSLLLSVYLPWPRPFLAPFDVNRWVCVQLNALLPEGTAFKWPNDLMQGTKKLGGLLIENHWNSSGIYASIVGIGINLDRAEGAHERAAFYNEAAEKDTTAKELALKVLDRFAAQLSAGEVPAEALRKQYYQLLWGRTKWMRYKDALGSFEAKVQHITPDGALVLQHKDGPSKVYELDEVKWLDAADAKG